jgi:hypothetical protein
VAHVYPDNIRAMNLYSAQLSECGDHQPVFESIAKASQMHENLEKFNEVNRFRKHDMKKETQALFYSEKLHVYSMMELATAEKAVSYGRSKLLFYQQKYPHFFDNKNIYYKGASIVLVDAVSFVDQVGPYYEKVKNNQQDPQAQKALKQAFDHWLRFQRRNNFNTAL